MNVGLLHPPLRTHRRNIASGIVSPPLWAALLAPLVQQQGHTVSVVDTVGEAPDHLWPHGGGWFRGLDFAATARRIHPETNVVLVSCMYSSSWPMVRDLLAHLMPLLPQAVFVVGGEHTSALPETVFAQSAAQVIVLGEGEETLTELLARLETQNIRHLNLHGVRGTWWRDAAGVVHAENPRPRLRQLDDLPQADWSLLPMDSYFSLRAGHGSDQGFYLPMLASRGCPYRCTFCASPASWGAPWVARSPARVVQEMLQHHARYGVSDFHFTDLTMLGSREWMHDFCHALIEKQASLTWQIPTGTRSEHMSAELAALMKQAGCTHLSFAIESGDPDMLGRVGKQLNLQKQRQSARAVLRSGLHLFGFFIIGFPQETWASLWRTWGQVMRYAAMGMHEIHVSAFAPVPGCTEFRMMQQSGRITVDDDFLTRIFNWATLGHQETFCPAFSTRALRALVFFFFTSFFVVSWALRPWRPLGELWSLLVHRRPSGKLVRVLRSFWGIRRLQAKSGP